MNEQDEINWERRRYEIARDYAVGMFTNPDFETRNKAFRNYDETLNNAVLIAEHLISALKNEQK